MTKAEERALEAYPQPKELGRVGVIDWLKEYRRGFIKGYEQAEKDLGWISVNNRLPEKDGWYFTCVEMSGIPQCLGLSHFETYSGQWDDDDDSIELVDYWMEKPKLPGK